MNKQVSILIVTYNSIDLIKDCIASIFKFNDIPEEQLEVIVVDNSDEITSVQLFELIRKEFGERIVLIKNKANLGYGQGNNVGIDAASGAVICIMNPDVRFTEPLLQKVQNNFEKNANLCLLGFKQMGGKNISFHPKPEFYLGFCYSIIIKLTNRWNLFYKNKFHLSGAFMFLDKKKFIEIGKFDENFFMYYEETDIATRIQNRGYDIQFIKENKYLHLVENRGFTSRFSLNAGLASLQFYFDKNKFDKNKFYKTKNSDYKFRILIATILGDKLRASNIRNEMTMFNEGWAFYLESRNIDQEKDADS